MKPIVFSKKKITRCMICLDEEISSWVSQSIEMTKSEGEPKPSVELIHRALKDAYPDGCPLSVSSTRNHLQEHEEIWNSWKSEDSAGAIESTR